MAKRDILRAAKRKGLMLGQISYDWQPTPGESVPTWSIYIPEESQDKFDCDGFVQFANTAEVLDWIEDLQPASALGEGVEHVQKS